MNSQIVRNAAILILASVLFSCNSIPKETKEKATEYYKQINGETQNVSDNIISFYDSVSAISGNIFSGIDLEKAKQLSGSLTLFESKISAEIESIKSAKEFDETIPYGANSIKILENYKKIITSDYSNLLSISTSDIDPSYIMKLDSVKVLILKNLIAIERDVISNNKSFCEKYSIENKDGERKLSIFENALSNLEYKIESLKRVTEMQ
ncbi:MAG: hypothetical protein IPO21_02190 [Bacteroidales bacterium]|nr:hypothetical protein [Bacteroidales bacterium]